MDKRVQKVLDTAGEHGLELKKESVKFEDMGLDFQVAFAADISKQDWVLRLPRRQDAFQKIAQEKKVLDLVGSAQEVFHVPHWEIFEEDLIAYKKLENEPAVTAIAETGEEKWLFNKDDVPKNYIRSFGRALAALHGIPVEAARKTGMPIHSGAEIRDLMKKRMDKVNDNYDVNDNLWNRWMRWIEDDTIWPEETAVMHGDLFPGHTLIDAGNNVAGIIDWTEAKVSDPANDFTAFHLLFGEDKLDELIEIYSDAGGYTWPGMKTHIISLLATQAVTIAEFAETSGLDEYREMAEKMLLEE